MPYLNGVPIEGVSTAQHGCKYDLLILEAFLIDACRYATLY